MKKFCGVYLIMSTDEQLVYVGGSTNCLNRFSWHKALLKNGEHPYPILIPYWEKKELEFTLVAECSKEELHDIEQIWMDKYPNRINIKKRADGKGFGVSEEAKLKMSEAAKI